jgi:hypothetical protein
MTVWSTTPAMVPRSDTYPDAGLGTRATQPVPLLVRTAFVQVLPSSWENRSAGVPLVPSGVTVIYWSFPARPRPFASSTVR